MAKHSKAHKTIGNLLSKPSTGSSLVGLSPERIPSFQPAATSIGRPGLKASHKVQNPSGSQFLATYILRIRLLVLFGSRKAFTGMGRGDTPFIHFAQTNLNEPFSGMGATWSC